MVNYDVCTLNECSKGAHKTVALMNTKLELNIVNRTCVLTD
jgi:hypothetical protein